MTADNKKEGVEWDQREYEARSFATGYKAMQQFEAKMYGEDDPKYFRKFVAQVRTLANMMLGYVDDDDLTDKAYELREHTAKEINKMRKMDNYAPGVDVLDAYRDIIEELRHNTNFKIPENSSYDPEHAGVKQLG